VLNVMTGDYDALRIALDDVPVGKAPVLQGDFIVSELVVIFVRFDTDERQGEAKGAGVIELELAEVVHLERSPSHHGRDARGNQYQCVARAYRNIQPTMGPIAFHGADAQQDVRGE